MPRLYTSDQVLEKMERVYEFISQFIKENHYSPTIREICRRCDIPSTGSAFYYVHKLKKQGRIDQSNLMGRVFTPKFYNETFEKAPVLNKIKVENTTIFDEENIEGVFPIPAEFKGERDCFVFKIKDNYMLNCGFMKNDYAICKKFSNFSNGDIAVVVLEGVVTARRVYNIDCRLLARTDFDGEMIETYIGQDSNIIGKVIGITRRVDK